MGAPLSNSSSDGSGLGTFADTAFAVSAAGNSSVFAFFAGGSEVTTFALVDVLMALAFAWGAMIGGGHYASLQSKTIHCNALSLVLKQLLICIRHDCIYDGVHL